MSKIIRPTYPIEFSIGLLLLIFFLSFFLAGQIFIEPVGDIEDTAHIYFGMFLVSTSIIIMLLILWEEFLFPIKVDPGQGEVVFRNHRTKLKIQAVIYLSIPAIFTFIYLNYDVNKIRFFIWATVCVVAPVAGKLVSGINNYNDFLKLTYESIAYKNNEKAGVFAVSDMQEIKLIKDERNVLHKIQVVMADNSEVVIDLDEMELEDFYAPIEQSMITHYKTMIK